MRPCAGNHLECQVSGIPADPALRRMASTGVPRSPLVTILYILDKIVKRFHSNVRASRPDGSCVRNSVCAARPRDFGGRRDRLQHECVWEGMFRRWRAFQRGSQSYGSTVASSLARAGDPAVRRAGGYRIPPLSRERTREMPPQAGVCNLAAIQEAVACFRWMTSCRERGTWSASPQSQAGAGLRATHGDARQASADCGRRAGRSSPSGWRLLAR
jgi:hypothetical protein